MCDSLRKTTESIPVIRRRSAAPEVFVDDVNSVSRPAQRACAFNQGILPSRGLGVRKDLHRRRLTDIEVGPTLQMHRMNLVFHHDSPNARSSLPEPEFDEPTWPTTPAAAAVRTARAHRSSFAPQARR